MGFTDSTPLVGDPSALRARAEADGYLYFRGLLPRDPVFQLREALVGLCRSHGFFEAPPLDSEGRIDVERMAAFYAEAYRLRALHALGKQPAIMEAFRQLFGRQPVPHARTVLRSIPHGTDQVWPAHQDFANVGTHAEVWNVWTPVGDCSRRLGVLEIMPGSHRYGPATERRPQDGLFTERPPDGLEWLSGDMACGDVVAFNCLTFHRGRPNGVPGSFRLSVDNCLQPIDTEFISGAFEPHRGDQGLFNRGLDWDDIYAGWPEDDPLRYYWHALDLRFAEPVELRYQAG